MESSLVLGSSADYRFARSKAARHCQVVEPHTLEHTVFRDAKLAGEPPQHRNARQAFPRLECPGAKRLVLFCGGVATTMQEQIAHLILDRSGTLQVTRRFEAAHYLLAHTYRLERALSACCADIVRPRTPNPGSPPRNS